MATITGTSGNDRLTGTSGDDHIIGLALSDSLFGLEGSDTLEGGDGSDWLDDGAGNDLALGGEGADIFDNKDGSDTLDGGGDDDLFMVSRGSGQADVVSLIGGTGKDDFELYSIGPSDFIVDAGDGDDFIRIDTYKGNHRLTLGSGIDTVAVVSPLFFADFLSTTITDFTPGAGGDRLDFSDFFARSLSGWDGNQNPFALGFVRLVQSGADAVLEIDQDGGGNSYVEYIRLEGISAASLTWHNLDGFPADGSVPPSLTIDGTAAADRIFGAAGDDFLSGYAGDDDIQGGAGADTISGDDGNDRIYGEGGNDIIEGGAGGDQLYDGAGDDIVRGGADGDVFQSQESGNDLLEGGGGGDYFDVRRRSDYQVTVDGGDGDDTLNITTYSRDNLFTLIGGAGNDLLNIMSMAGTAQISLGAGADVINLTWSDYSLADTGLLIVSDFETGDGGDRLDFDQWLASTFNWDQVSNPFKTGQLRLVQSGADTLLQADRDGGNDSWRTVVKFTGRDATTFTPFNLDGFAADGSDPVGVTLIGSAATETLTGTNGADRIEGRGGADTLQGLGGADLIIGGDQNDWLQGGTGDDRLEGGAGSDIIDGGPGDDLVYAGEGNDLVYVNAGADTVWGGAGNDELRMQASPPPDGTVTLRGEAGSDTLAMNYSNPNTFVVADGGADSDTFVIGDLHGIATVTLGDGADRIVLAGNAGAGGQPGQVTVTDFTAGAGGDFLDLPGSLGLLLLNWNGSDPFKSGHLRLVQLASGTLLQIDRDAGGSSHDFVTVLTLTGVNAGALTADNLGYASLAVSGTFGDDSLQGGGGDDALSGRAGNDSLEGRGGNDTLDGGLGADSMTGGTGSDIYYVDNAGDSVNENPGEGTDEIRTSLAVYSLAGLANVENLTGSDNSNHDFRGNSGDNVITGGGGNDTIRVYDGGNDTVHGGAGDDLIFIGAALTAADVIDGGADIDTLIIQGNYPGGLTLTANVTNIENLSILNGANTSIGASGTELYDYVITTNDANFAAGLQVRVNAGALLPGEDFTFNGSAETNAGFVIYGGRGKDTLTGGLGNDIFFFAEQLQFAPGDTVNGGAGYDSVYFRGNYTIDFNAPGYAGQFNSIESMTLTSASDTRYARGGPSEFDYSITLADANLAAGVTLTINGTLLQSFETMVIDGSQETDGFLRIFAGSADDTIKGGGQADLIHGNFGADTLTGGGGADTFRYQKSGESTATSMDHILDFTPGTDKIELTRMDANTLAAGNQDFHWIGSDAFSAGGAGSAGELRAYEQSGTWFVEGDTNGDGGGDFLIALTLQGQTPLGQSDFFL
jgi:Ca2+-binding RTX toxin-like protein